jgi:hypothetical protein
MVKQYLKMIEKITVFCFVLTLFLRLYCIHIVAKSQPKKHN